MKNFFQLSLILGLGLGFYTGMNFASALEGEPLQFLEYEVRFTNPNCQDYFYEHPIQSVSDKKNGKPPSLQQKPSGVYCSTQGDWPNSGGFDSKGNFKVGAGWQHSPQSKLIEWIEAAREGDEIFMAYYSMRNRFVLKALKFAIANRSVKVRVYIDPSQYSSSSKAAVDDLVSTEPANSKPEFRPEYIPGYRNSEIQENHDKFTLVLSKSAAVAKISFGSGNMTGGALVNHENWHFVTVPLSSYFAQSHLCLREGLIDWGTRRIDANREAFRDTIRKCKKQIGASEETDIKTMFVPGEGERATGFMVQGIARAAQVFVAAHRISLAPMIAELKKNPRVKIVVDDDLYWTQQGHAVGDNNIGEARTLELLKKTGAEVRYMQTNDTEHQLHHNKYLVYMDSKGNPFGVSTGSPNLTAAGHLMYDFYSTFDIEKMKWLPVTQWQKRESYTNHENAYYITIPAVLEAYRGQVKKVWNQMATSEGDMPALFDERNPKSAN